MLTLFSGIASRVVPFFFILILISADSKAADSSLAPLESGLFKLISRLSQSVVTIEASKSRVEPSPIGPASLGIVKIIASGVVFDSLGHIIVAASSVTGRDKLYVVYGGFKISARLIGVDYQTGLALIKSARPIGRAVEALENYRCAGQLVIAVGNSYGLHASPSLGFCAGARDDGSLQFSAAITSGSIGGGLFDLSGRLIGAIIGGIGSGERTEAGLAVPASEIPAIVEHLIKHGDRRAGYLGVTIGEIEISPPLEIGSVNSMISGQTSGFSRLIEQSAVITEVVQFSPAARARLRQGDLIISVNGEQIHSALEFVYRIKRARSGSILRLELIRQNELIYADVEIGSRNADLNQRFRSSSGSIANGKNSQKLIYQELETLKKAVRRLQQQLHSINSQDID
ncbi:MAG: serine protease [candidate division Zixibacteria bacterium]|nr:serine protease [candidate division Zixibacteria bacterium]